MNGFQPSPFGALPLPYTTPAHITSGFPAYPQQQNPVQQRQPVYQQHQRQSSLSRPGNAAAQHGCNYSPMESTYLNKAAAQLYRLPTPPGMYDAPHFSAEVQQQQNYGYVHPSVYSHSAVHDWQLGAFASSCDQRYTRQNHQLPPEACDANQSGHRPIDNTTWQRAIMAPGHHFGNGPFIDPPARYESLPLPQPPQGQSYHPGWHAVPGYLKQNLAEQIPLQSNFYDSDHPSFAKPPHRHSSHHRADSRANGQGSFNEAEADQSLALQEEWQLIAPGASAIPPPAPIEQSAYPLAALATDIVWEAFIAAAHSTKSSRNFMQFTVSQDRYPNASPTTGNGSSPPSLFHSRNRECYSSSPSTPFSTRPHSQMVSPYLETYDRMARAGSAGLEAPHHLAKSFGAIGGERRPRVPDNEHANQAASPISDISSPASSAPGTPAAEGTSLAWSSGLRVWDDEPPTFSPAQSRENFKNRAFNPLSSKFEIGSRFENPSPPRALFEQISKLLGATLLSQQVLLLALYFIARLPPTSPLYPPATSSSALRSTSAPFKLLLAALVVANKHLDDNSFRNSTFASVSDVALHEINALEHSLLAALSFDVNVEPENWLNWLRDLEQQIPTRFLDNQISVNAYIGPLIDAVCGQQGREEGVGVPDDQINLDSSPVMQCSPQAVDYHSSPVLPVPAARARTLSYGDSCIDNYSPRSDGSYSTSFDFDAPVPHELRPKYAENNNRNNDFFRSAPIADLWGRPIDRTAYSYERGTHQNYGNAISGWNPSSEMAIAA